MHWPNQQKVDNNDHQTNQSLLPEYQTQAQKQKDHAQTIIHRQISWSEGIWSVDGQPTRKWLATRFVWCLLANAGQPLLLDILRTHGAANWSTFIYILPTYYAMILLLFAKRKKSIWQENWKTAAFLSFCDLFHQLIEKIGLIYAGSSVYIVASSSTTAWVAIFSLIILKKSIPLQRLIALTTICTGIVMRGISAGNTIHLDASLGKSQLFGGFLTIVAAAIHAGFYILNEKFMTGDAAIEGPNLVIMMGIISSTILTLWTCIYTIPRWNQLISQPVAQHHGDYRIIALVLFGLLLCSTLRAITLWALIKHGGAVVSGLLKGARLSLVMLVNHWCFCPKIPGACLNLWSATAASMCGTGVIWYSAYEDKVDKK